MRNLVSSSKTNSPRDIAIAIDTFLFYNIRVTINSKRSTILRSNHQSHLSNYPICLPFDLSLSIWPVNLTAKSLSDIWKLVEWGPGNDLIPSWSLYDRQNGSFHFVQVHRVQPQWYSKPLLIPITNGH